MKVKRAGLLVLAGFALLDPLLAIAQQTQPPWDGPGPWHMWGGGWGMGWIFHLLMMFFLIFCVVAFLFSLRSGGWFHHCGPRGHMRGWEDGAWGDPAHSALRILNERFARGEIQKAEYEERKAAILSRGPR